MAFRPKFDFDAATPGPWTASREAHANMQFGISALQSKRDALLGRPDYDKLEVDCLTNMITALETGCHQVLLCFDDDSVDKAHSHARAEAKRIHDDLLQSQREREEELEMLSRATTVDAASEEIAAIYTSFLTSIRAAYDARGKAVADQLRAPTMDPEQHARLVQSSSDEGSKLIASTMEQGTAKREEIVGSTENHAIPRSVNFGQLVPSRGQGFG
jgi:hypothetical protein